MTIRILVIAFLVVTPAFSQSISEGGTVIVSEHLADEIVIAADSRLVKVGKAAVDDHDCKIRTYKNQGIFAASGITHLKAHAPDGKVLEWNANKTAKDAWAHSDSKKQNETKSEVAARFWADRCKRFYEQALKGSEGPKVKQDIDTATKYGIIADGIFISNDSGNLNSTTANVSLNEDGTVGTKMTPTKVHQTTAMGHNELVQNLSNQKNGAVWGKWYASLPPGLTQNQIEERIVIQLVQWTIDSKSYDNVGGDVNAAVMGTMGLRWLTDFSYCKGQ